MYSGGSQGVAAAPSMFKGGMGAEFKQARNANAPYFNQYMRDLGYYEEYKRSWDTPPDSQVA